MSQRYETGDNHWGSRRVKELRRRLGLSQQAMARELGVRQQTVSDWEQGVYAPRGASRRVLSMVAEQPARHATGPRTDAPTPAQRRRPGARDGASPQDRARVRRKQSPSEAASP